MKTDSPKGRGRGQVMINMGLVRVGPVLSITRVLAKALRENYCKIRYS